MVVSGTDAEGRSFRDDTWTIAVNEHGATLATGHRLEVNSEIVIENTALGQLSKARVVSARNGMFLGQPFEAGIELVGAAKVWGIRFPSGEPKPGVSKPVESTGSAPDASISPIAADNQPMPSAAVFQDEAGPTESMEMRDLAGTLPKIESTPTALNELPEKAEEASGQPKAETEEAGRWTIEIAGPALESALQQYQNKLQDGAASAVREAVTQAREQWENTFQNHWDEMAGKQLAESAERVREEIRRQQSDFQVSVQAMIGDAGKELAAVAEELRQSMRSESGTHLTVAISQMRQETSDVLALLKEDIRKELAAASSSYRSELDRSVQASFESARQRTDAEISKVLEGAMNSLREQMTTALGETREKSMQGLQRIQAAMPKLVEGPVNAVREQVSSLLDESRREAAQGLQQTQAELGRVRNQAIEEVRAEADRMVQGAIESARQHVESEIQQVMETRLDAACQRVAEGEAQLAAASERAAAEIGATIETEYRGKAERVFVESMEGRMRDFEAQLATTGQERLAAVNNLLDQQFGPAREQIEELSVRAAQNALGVIQQGIGSAAVMLKDWADQSTERLEGAVQSAARNSQQQIAAFMQTAMGELHQGADLEIRHLRSRLLEAASVLENAGQGGPGDMHSGPKSAATPAGPLTELSQRPAGTMDEPDQAAVNDVLKQIRAKFDEILKRAS